jgi:hypothetical protein
MAKTRPPATAGSYQKTVRARGAIDLPAQGFGVVVVVPVVVVVVVVVAGAAAGGQIAASENARSAAVVPVDVVTSMVVGVVVRLKFAIAPRIFEPAWSVPALARSEQLVTSVANATL